MSILSTNQKLVRVGQEYSAGNGIEISSYVISYTGDVGREYSAGENIGINDYVISSRNWSPDITYAAESAFQRANEYTNTQISALSGDVSSEVSQLGSDIQYISGVALTSHQSLEGYLTKASGDEYYQPIGSYATVSQLESTSGEIVNLIPSIEGLATEEYVNEQTSGKADKSEIPDVTQFITNTSAEQTYQPIGNYATQEWVGEQGYITGVDLSNYYTKNETSGAEELAEAFSQIGPGGDEEVNELVRSNSGEWNNVSAKLDSTAFSTVSGDFLTSIPDEYATKDFVSNSITGKLDISSFSSVSGDFLTNEDLNGYATESFVENVSGDITALIPTDYATNTQVNELSGAIDYVSANAGDQEVHNIVHTNSATWDSVTNKLDTTAFSNVSGDFLVASSLNGYATETLVQDTSANITALIPDTSNFITNASAESTYQTIAGMVDYQTKADMTAYQPVGSYATTNELEQVSADITATIPSTAGLASESYVQTNSAVLTGMIDAKQDTLTFGYDEQDRISAINNSAVAGGTDIEFEYDSADNISAINNSALTDVSLNNIVQTNSGAWGGSALPISAGPGIKVNLVDNTLVFSNDETVLYSGSPTWKQSITLSESPLNFSRIKVLFGNKLDSSSFNEKLMGDIEFVPFTENNYLYMDGVLRGGSREWHAVSVWSGISGTSWNTVSGKLYGLGSTENNTNNNFCSPYLVIGINRK